MSRQDRLDLPEGFILSKSLWEALDIAQKAPGKIIWIIGGAQIYALALKYLVINQLHVTIIDGDFPAKNPADEIRFPEIDLRKFNYAPFHTQCFLKRTPVHDDDPKKNDRGNSHDFTIRVLEGI